MGAQVSFTAYGREALEALRAVVAEAKKDDPMAPVTVLVPNNIAGIVARRSPRPRPRPRAATASPASGSPRSPGSPSSWPRRLSPAQGRRPATRPVTDRCHPRLPRRRARRLRPGGRAPRHRPSPRPRTPDAPRRRRRRAPAPRARPARSAATSSACTARPPQRLIGGWYDTTDLLHTATQLVTEAPARSRRARRRRPLPAAGPQPRRDRLRAGPRRRTRHARRRRAHRRRPCRAAVHAAVAVAGTRRRAAAARPRQSRALTACSPPPTPTTRSAASSARSCAALREHPGPPGGRALRQRVALRPAAPRAPRRRRHHRQRPGRAAGRRARPVTPACSGCSRPPAPASAAPTSCGPSARSRTTAFAGERISVARWERVSREAGVVAGADWDAGSPPTSSDQERGGHDGGVRVDPRARARATATPPRRCATSSPSCSAGSPTPPCLRPGRSSVAWTLELLHDLVPRPPPALPARGAVRRRRRRAGAAGLAALDTSGPAARPRRPSRRSSASSWSRPSPASAGSARACWSPLSPTPSGSTSTSSSSSGSPRTSTPAGSTTTPCCPNGCGTLHLGQLPSHAGPPRPPSTGSLLAAFAVGRRTSRRASRAATCGEQRSGCPAAGCCPPCASSAATPTSPRRSGTKGADAAERWLHSSPSFAGSRPHDRRAQHRAGVARCGRPPRARDLRRRRRRRPRASCSAPASRPSSPASTATSPARRGCPTTRPASGSSPRPRWSATPSARTRTSSSGCSCVEPVEAPEEVVEISALDVGNLVHESFDQLVTEAAERGELPGYGAAMDRRRSGSGCSEIADAKADELRGRGPHRPPAAVAAAARSASSPTLDWMLDDDDAWRAEHDARVVASELPFGMSGAEPVDRPAAAMAARCAFRGSADKVDQAPRRHPPRHRHQDRQPRTFKVPQGRPGRRRREAPAARLRHGGTGRPRRRRHPGRGARTGSSPAQGARADRAAAHRRGRRAPTPTTVRLARQSASPAGLFPPRPPEDPDFALGAVRLLQPRRARPRRGPPGRGSASGSAPSSRSSPRSSTA